jgi:formylglycine-generating enzyme required for sulfatase activity
VRRSALILGLLLAFSATACDRPTAVTPGGREAAPASRSSGGAVLAAASARAAPQGSPDLTIDTIVFVAVPPGNFVMGSPEDEPGRDPEERQRLVPLPSRFWLSKTEITQEQFERVMGSNPSLTRGHDLPVTCVACGEAEDFCRRLSNQEYRVRLPTEEEWEYGCRAGSALPFGSSPGGVAQLRLALDKHRAGDTDYLVRFVSRQAWFNGPQPRAVGTLLPNAWGLHDMQGNVWEWCAADPSRDGLSPIRGGAWSSPDVWCCRAAQRGWEGRNVRKDSIGFRALAERADD